MYKPLEKVIRIVRNDGVGILYRVVDEDMSVTLSHNDKHVIMCSIDPENNDECVLTIITHLCEDYITDIGDPVRVDRLIIPADVRQAQIDYAVASRDRSEGKVERWQEKARMRVSIFKTWDVTLS